MREKIKKFKELWAVPRYRGLMKLGVGLLFMVIVYFMIGGFAQMVPMDQLPGINDDNSNKKSTNILENYKNIESCEYSYLIEVSNQKGTGTYKIEGTYYNKNYYFTYNNQTYFIKDNEVYLVDDASKKLLVNKQPLSMLDVKILNIDSLYTFMSSSIDNGSTKYKDGSEIKKYSYTSYDNKKINIEANGKSNMFNDMVIDFKEYVSGYTAYTVTITYKNINNILNYDKDYTNYEITKEGA